MGKTRLLAGLFVALAGSAIASCSGGGGGTGSPAPIGSATTAPAATATPVGATPTPTPRASVAPTATPTSNPTSTPTPHATPTATPVGTATMPPPASSTFVFPSGFSGVVAGTVPGARELLTLPNGDLLIGTNQKEIWILPHADAATSGGPAVGFITLSEAPAESIAYANGAIYAGTNTTIWRIPYTTGDRSEPPSSAVAIAHVRTGSVAPNSDGDVHTSTSVAVSGSTLYASVGSSCNACIEVDPTRAAVLKMHLDGSSVTNLAENARNPIALAVNPATGSLWIGGAGQDNLTYKHPYEYFDSPTLRGSSDVNYGWPACEENHHLYNPLGTSPAPNCAATVEPAIEFNSYATLIGATFYPANQTGAYVFPASYRGGLFVTSHGSWHCCPSTPPRVYFVPMNGDTPATPVDWNDPTVQHSDFVAGFGTTSSSSYFQRPTGVAVGSAGSLFFAMDSSGQIIRIRHN